MMLCLLVLSKLVFGHKFSNIFDKSFLGEVLDKVSPFVWPYIFGEIFTFF